VAKSLACVIVHPCSISIIHGCSHFLLMNWWCSHLWRSNHKYFIFMRNEIWADKQYGTLLNKKMCLFCEISLALRLLSIDRKSERTPCFLSEPCHEWSMCSFTTSILTCLPHCVTLEAGPYDWRWVLLTRSFKAVWWVLTQCSQKVSSHWELLQILSLSLVGLSSGIISNFFIDIPRIQL
jgi:hypothetical protein